MYGIKKRKKGKVIRKQIFIYPAFLLILNAQT